MRNVFLRRATEEDTHLADLPPSPNSARSKGSDTRMRRARGSPPSIPRWVKVLAIIALVLFLLFVILRFTVIPSIHSLGGHTGFGGQTPPTSVIAYGGQQL